MSEPNSPEMSPDEKERIILAQAEIKSLLLPRFRDTALEAVFSERKVTTLNAEYRGLHRDYVGNRIISGDEPWSTDDRELKVYLKPKNRVPWKDIGQSIRMVEADPRSGSLPKIEHFTLEFGGGQRPFELGADPLITAVELARQIATGKS